MSLVVTPLLTDIDLAESATPWSTGTVDLAFKKQGNSSLAFYMAKNARSSITVTPAASVAWSTHSLPHLYFWLNSAVAAVMENKSTGTTTASGITARVTLSSGAYREWHVTGADTWDGSWTDCFVIDMSHTGTELYASSGTWTNTSNIASVTWYVDLSNSGNIRNVPANCWIDAIRVGDGLQVHNTSAADPSFDFSDIAAVDEAVAYRYGVMATKDGIIFSQGRLIIGDSSGTNHVDFDSQKEILVFSDRDGSGKGIVNASLYQLIFAGNSTGTDQDVSMGVKVGTGDDATGRNGTQVLSGSTNVSWLLQLSDGGLHNATFYGSTFRGANYGVFWNWEATTLNEMAGCTFDECSQVDSRSAEVRNCVFLNTDAASTSGALRWEEYGLLLYDNFDDNDLTSNPDWGTPPAGLTNVSGYAQVVVDSTNTAPAVFKDLTPTNSSEVWTQFETYLDSHTSSDGQYIQGGGLWEDTTYYKCWLLGFHNDGGTLRWKLTYYEDGGVQFQANGTSAIIQDEWYAVQVQWKASTGVGADDGILKVWINGVLEFNLTDLDTDAMLADYFQLGNNYRSGMDVTYRINSLSCGAAQADVATDVKNCLFVNNVVGVEVPSLTGDMAFAGMESSGNTNDVRYEGSVDWDLNYDGSAPSVQNASDGTLTPVSSKTATFTPLTNGSAFTITKDSDNSILKDVSSVTGGQVIYSYDGALDGTATTVHIIIVGKEPIDFPWTVAEGTVPISQITDRIYSNP